MIIEYIGISYILTIAACVISLAIASYLYGIALSKIIKGSLFNISRNTRVKTDQFIFTEQIIEFLDLYSSEQQLSGGK